MMFFSCTILACLLASGSCYSSGAPSSACSSMTPNHRGASNSSGANALYALGAPEAVSPGQEVEIHIGGGAFAGFLLRGLDASGNGAGQFVRGGGDYSVTTCQNSDDSATHSDGSTKPRGVSLTWRAPQETGTYRILATIVTNYHSYHTGYYVDIKVGNAFKRSPDTGFSTGSDTSFSHTSSGFHQQSMPQGHQSFHHESFSGHESPRHSFSGHESPRHSSSIHRQDDSSSHFANQPTSLLGSPHNIESFHQSSPSEFGSSFHQSRPSFKHSFHQESPSFHQSSPNLQHESFHQSSPFRHSFRPRVPHPSTLGSRPIFRRHIQETPHFSRHIPAHNYFAPQFPSPVFGNFQPRFNRRNFF